MHYWMADMQKRKRQKIREDRPMIKPAFAYLRVSGKNQIKGHGFERQLQTIRAFAKANGYDIQGVYREKGVSGTLGEMERPAFSEMLRDMLSNGVRVVIIEGMDRLARLLRVQEHLLVYLASKRIDLVSAATGENVTQAISEDPMKKALVQIQGVFAELDKSLLVRKLKKARDAKRAKAGKCEGAKRYGEDSPQEQAIMKRIYYLRRKPRGLNKKPKTYQDIADILNAEDVPTKRGRPWTPTQVWRIVNHK
jgi:DNA invertase Pin-like site-specific DNA recombinase